MHLMLAEAPDFALGAIPVSGGRVIAPTATVHASRVVGSVLALGTRDFLYSVETDDVARRRAVANFLRATSGKLPVRTPFAILLG